MFTRSNLILFPRGLAPMTPASANDDWTPDDPSTAHAAMRPRARSSAGLRQGVAR